ncbi:MAG: RteC domain-containing protein [Mucilaginibacter sp.]
MKDFINKLYTEMEEDLSVFADAGTTPVNRLSSSLNCVAMALDKLKAYVDVHAFETEAAEIEFFKVHKPWFYSWKIYLVEQYGIQANVPKGSLQMQRHYYLNELALLERIHNQYRHVHQYYTDHENYRDAEYFLRANYVSYLPGQDYHQPLAGFSTNQDYLFARFRANGMLQDFLIKKVTLLENAAAEELAGKVLTRRKRRWTGDKINLIEIAYGIYFTGQMNDGKADIKEIIAWLETSLNIDLSQAYRMFLDIRRRKTTSYTKFLECMCAGIAQHIEETWNYKPKKKHK